MTDTERQTRTELTAARRRHGLTQEEAAERVGVTRASFARWERGEQDVRLCYRRALAELFDVSVEEVEGWIDEPRAFPRTREVLCLSYVGSLRATVDNVADLWRWDVDPARRSFLAGLPFVPAALNAVLSGWRFDALDANTSGNSSNRLVGLGDVQRLHEARQAFTQMDHQYGGALVRPATVAYLEEHVTPLLRGSYTDQVGRELFSAAAALTAQAGWMAYDECRQGLAQRHYTQALRMAKAGNDPLTAAQVLATMSQQAIDLDRPEWATRLARAARDAGREAHTAPRVQAMLTIREARALALSVSLGGGGNQHVSQTAENLLAEAEHVLEYADGQDNEPTWIYYFTPAEFNGEATSCWRLLGRYGKAAECAQRALQGLDGSFQRSRLLNMMHLAEARIGQDDLDGALEMARGSVPAARALRSPRAAARVINLPLSNYQGEPRVSEYREYVRAELAVAA